jgi:hypothetical protein
MLFQPEHESKDEALMKRLVSRPRPRQDQAWAQAKGSKEIDSRI